MARMTKLKVNHFSGKGVMLSLLEDVLQKRLSNFRCLRFSVDRKLIAAIVDSNIKALFNQP